MNRIAAVTMQAAIFHRVRVIIPFLRVIRNLGRIGVQLLDAAASLTVHALSRLSPRDPSIWLFSSLGGRFTDNTKYFFLHVARHCNDCVRPVWISRDRKAISQVRTLGFEAHHPYSIRGFVLLLRAGLYVFTHYVTDISWALSGGAQKLNLWHAISVKKTNYDNVLDRARNPRGLMDIVRNVKKRMIIDRPGYWLLATSREVQQEFARTFRLPVEDIIISGYPRNDILLEPEAARRESSVADAVLKQAGQQGCRGISLYMPTHRSTENRILELVDFTALDKFLRGWNLLLLIKPHPSSRLCKVDDADLSHVRFIPGSADPYPLLAQVDCLISDYSSVLFDFLLTDRPQLFFPFDMDEYLRSSRELCYDYANFVPGPIVRTRTELQEALVTAMQSTDDGFAERRAALRARFFASTRPDACATLFGIVAHRLGIEIADQRESAA